MSEPGDAPAPSSEPRARLELRGVSKRFGSTLALESVDLTVHAGEVHALVGENGAGKSTLMNILTGSIAPDSGELRLEGRSFRPRDPAAASRAGLAMIHQELTLAPHLSVEANILLGMENRRAGFLSRSQNLARARTALELLGRPDIDLDRPLHELKIGERQLVEIARALAAEARVIVMDEPTSSLSGEAKEHLFEIIGRLRERGVSVIYISHFLEEVKQVADRFTVLRDGRNAGSCSAKSTGEDEIIRMMVGRTLGDVFPGGDRENVGEPILRLTALTGKRTPQDVTLELRRGEILGLAGLIGAGRTETLRAAFGLDPVASGEVRLLDAQGTETLLGRGSRSRIQRGVGLLSEDRKAEGLATNLSIAENIVMASPRTVSRFGFVSASKLRRAAGRWIDELSIRSAAPELRVAQLSGGNQQKVAVARLLQMQADVLLLDEPTRGIDIGSKVEIYRLMHRLAGEGRAIIFVSSYLPELLGVCSRIGVMSRGRLAALKPAGEWSEHGIMLAATGGGGEL